MVRYADRKLVVATHIGSAHTSEELKLLRQVASAWIEKTTRQESLFAMSARDQLSGTGLALVDKCEYLGIRYTFIYQILHKLLSRFGFTAFGSAVLNDLVIMRIVKPVSKLQSMELLKEYFGINHRRQTFYEIVPRLVKLKDSAEQLAIKLATKEFNFDFSIVFYDVTTLYFESFKSGRLAQARIF